MGSEALRAHLKSISESPQLPEPHIAYLRKLKASGFEPAVIYDIGACVLHWTREAQLLWPRATFVLFDAFEPAAFLYEGYLHHVGVLAKEAGEVRFYQNDWAPGGNSYYREVGCEGGRHFPATDYRVLPTEALDEVVRRRQFPKPDLVKIDVQGSERDVIEGGLETLATAKHLIVEMQRTMYNLGAPLVTETLPFIEAQGWRCTGGLFCDNGPDGDYGFERVEEGVRGVMGGCKPP